MQSDGPMGTSSGSDLPQAGLSWFFLALTVLTLLGGGLRLYKLGEFPGGFGQDEAVVLYDAWSLLTTGAEHHGTAWPLNAKEFGDYPSALPSYLAMPFVVLLGPTELAARLPCALLNIAAIPLIGLLLFHLFHSRAAGVAAATLLAVSPWNLFFSRWAVSPGFVTFYQVAGLCLMIRLLTGRNHRTGVYGAAVLTGFILFLWTHQYLSQYFFAPFMIATGFLLWQRYNWPRILVAGGTYSLFMLMAILPRIANSTTAGRMHVGCVFFDDNPWTHLWHNYWEYQSFLFLFRSPTMLPLHQIPYVAHIQHSLIPLYIIGLLALATAALFPRRLLLLLGRPDAEGEAAHWRKAALWMIAGTLIAPITGALFIEKFYTARMTHMLTQALMVIALGCAVVWYLLRRISLRTAAPVFALLLALYLGQSVIKTARGLIRHDLYLKTYLQQGVPEVMRYLAQQSGVRSVRLPRMMQGYIYHLLFTPVHPARLDRTAITLPPQDIEQRWRHEVIPQIGNYFFNQDLDPYAIAATASLRHQVRDTNRIWYDLYEKDGHWYVLEHVQPTPEAPSTGVR